MSLGWENTFPNPQTSRSRRKYSFPAAPEMPTPEVVPLSPCHPAQHRLWGGASLAEQLCATQPVCLCL